MPFRGQTTDDRDQMGALALGDGGGCLGLEMPDGFRKNVYFGFGDFMNRVNALCGNRVYFCIPGRKRSPRKIKGLAENMSTFVYFCLPFTRALGGFV